MFAWSQVLGFIAGTSSGESQNSIVPSAGIAGSLKGLVATGLPTVEPQGLAKLPAVDDLHLAFELQVWVGFSKSTSSRVSASFSNFLVSTASAS